jgi:hypothetical protein
MARIRIAHVEVCCHEAICPSLHKVDLSPLFVVQFATRVNDKYYQNELK